MKYNNIIYGKRDKDLCFYFITLDLSYCITLGNFDENIFCKLLKIKLYICAYSANGKVKLKIFIYLDSEKKNKKYLYKRRSKFYKS